MLAFVNVGVERGDLVHTRDVLLQEAGRLFAARGFRGVSVHEIGAAAGVSGPAIYRHFANKEALLGAVLVSISERLLAGGRLRRAEEQDPAAALDALIRFHIAFALDHPELITVQDREFGNLPEDDRHRVRRLQRGYVEIWVDTLRTLRPALDAAVARAAVQATFGLLNYAPHSAARRTLPRDEMSALLHRVAVGALWAT